MSKYTFKDFQAEYPDDDACLAAIMTVQYGGTKITCPGCGADSTFTKIANRRAYACQWCGHHIYPCAGTIFHKSVYQTDALVLRHVLDDQHAPWRSGEGIGAANRLHLQNCVADGA